MQKKGLLTKIVVVLVLIAFLAAGLSSYNFESKKILAKVGKSKIYLDDFESNYKREVAYIKSTWGNYIDESQLKEFGLGNIVLRDMIHNKILDNLIQKINLDMSDASVISFIKNHEVFKKEDNTFDREKFLLFLHNNNISEKDYIKKIKEDFLRAIFLKVFALKHVNYIMVAEKIYESKLEKRVVEVMRVSYDKLDTVKNPSDEELEEYYDHHKNAFVKTEQRSGNIFFINEEHLSSEPVSEKEVIAEFESMGLDKRFTLKYVFFQNKKEAESFLANAGSYEDSLWQNEGDDKIILLNGVFASEIPLEIHDVLDNLEIGKTSPIIKTSAGYYIIFLEQVQRVSESERKTNYKIIQSDIEEHRKAEKFDALMLKIKNALDDGKSLEEIAESYGLLKIKKFSRLTEGESSELEEKITKEIFAAQVNQQTDFMQDSKGNYYGINVLEAIPSHIQNFSDVKDLVKKYWQAEKNFEIASTKLTQSIKSGKYDGSISKEKKIFSNPQIVAQATQNGHSEPYSQGYKSRFVDNIFNLKNVGDITSPIEDGSSVIIGVLKEKILPKDIDKKAKQENIKEINKTIKEVLHNSLLEEFIHYYSKIFKVEVDYKATEITN